jgi:hypothetical protein
MTSKAPTGLSTAFRFRFPGLEGLPTFRLWNFDGEIFDGERISISSSSNPSLCENVFFFLGVVTSLVTSFFSVAFCLFSLRTRSDSSAKSWRIKSRSVAAFFSAIRAAFLLLC